MLTCESSIRLAGVNTPSVLRYHTGVRIGARLAINVCPVTAVLTAAA